MDTKVRNSPPVVPPTARKRKPKDIEAAKTHTLKELGIKTKVINLLEAKKKISTVGGLFRWLSEEDPFTKPRGFGKTSLDQCKSRLEAWGFKFDQ